MNRMTSPEVDRRRCGLPEVTGDVYVVTCPIWPPDWNLAVVIKAADVAGECLLGSTYSALLQFTAICYNNIFFNDTKNSMTFQRELSQGHVYGVVWGG